MAKVRVGLVGHGFAAGLHMPGFVQLGPDRCEVVAVCGRDEARARGFAEKHGIRHAFGSMREMLAAVDVDAVDLAVPNHVHTHHCIEAAQAGKHLIVEKPLTGYFGEPDTPEGELVGKTIPKQHMLERVVEECDAILGAVKAAGVKLCYAENWCYAPAFTKLRRLASAAGGPILRIEAEESHSGSTSVYAHNWRTAGGGSLNLKGSHPLGAVLQLKQEEGERRTGKAIRPATIMCEWGNLTHIPAFQAETEKHLRIGWQDVEDWGVMIIKFEDGSVAEIKAADTTLGGVHNYLEAYLSNARLRANINPNNACVAYAPAAHVFADEYIMEKLETKAGWSTPGVDDPWMQGYAKEVADFVGAIAEDREPLSGAIIARDVSVVLYAAYVAAEEGRRVDLGPYLG
jgi:predicted dehydrogenase